MLVRMIVSFGYNTNNKWPVKIMHDRTFGLTSAILIISFRLMKSFVWKCIPCHLFLHRDFKIYNANIISWSELQDLPGADFYQRFPPFADIPIVF